MSGSAAAIPFGCNAMAICLNTPGNSCSSSSRGRIGDPASARGGLFFLSGGEIFMNIAASFSFDYVSSLSFAGSATVYDGLNGPGKVLGVLNLTPNAGNCAPEYSAGFCPLSPSGITFEGTAYSVSFGGVASQIVFDDITFGSGAPGPRPQPGIPEPATWAILITGFGLIGATARRRRRLAA